MGSPESLPEQTQHVCGGSAAAADSRTEGYVSAATFAWVTGVLLVYFGVRLIYFAVSISPFVPPDEVTHAGLCTVFAQCLLLPDNAPATYQFGLVTNIPWLYYFVFGKLLHLNLFGLPELVFLRLLNIPLAFATIYFARQTLLLLTHDRLAQLLLLVAMTNTAMFSLLSASVSYDNLANLLAAMAIYYLAAFLKLRHGRLLVAAVLCQLAGTLTKITFLPLSLALMVLLVLYAGKRLSVLPAVVGRSFRESAGRAWLTALLLLVAAGLNLQLYGGNYRTYGSLNPSMAVVLSPAAALNYRLDARGTIFSEYKSGRISYLDALILTGEIKHPGDKADTFYLLMNYEKLKSNPQLWLSLPDYAKVWLQIMVTTIFGIKAHLPMVKSPLQMAPVYTVLALAVLGFVLRYRPGSSGWLPAGLAAVALFYAGYLLYEVNYDSYLHYGEPSLTVYGRYLFPLLVPVYVLLCRYLLELCRNRFAQMTLALATALLFVVYDFPWFLSHATPEWFR